MANYPVYDATNKCQSNRRGLPAHRKDAWNEASFSIRIY